MKLKIAEIFTTLSDRSIYPVEELLLLNLRPSFIHEVSTFYNLTYEEDTVTDGNVCFSKNKDVRPEYRDTFHKNDILEIVLQQIVSKSVNLEKTTVTFPEKAHSFYNRKTTL